MNYKAFYTVLAVLIIVVTICVTAIKPVLHKSLMVYDSDYVVKTQEIVVVEEKMIPKQKPVIKTEEVTLPKQLQTQTVQKIDIPKTTVKTEKNTVKQVQPIQKEVQKTVQPVTKEEIKAEKKVIKTETKVEEKPIEKIDKQIAENIVKQEPIAITKQEEEIQWNKWRSRLQNQIMSDVNLPVVPQGIMFKFSFNVDKYGRVSEVHTWSTTPSYTPYAIQYIAPVIRSYQGRSILQFPAGSNRVTTTVEGGWRISANEKLSTPQDYNDIERVSR